MRAMVTSRARLLILVFVFLVGFPLGALAAFVYSAWWPPPALSSNFISPHGDFHCGEGRSGMGTSTNPGEGWGYVRTRLNSPSPCNGAIHAVPAGYLGAATRAWRRNSGTSTWVLCSTTGTAYTANAWSSFGVGALLCSNPAGSQDFYAQARPVHGYDFNGNVWYAVAPWGHSSPIQSY